MKKFAALVLAALMTVSLFACTTKPNKPSGSSGGDNTTIPNGIPNVDDGDIDYFNFDGKKYGEDGDYISVYDKYGKDVTVADVKKNSEGDYYITKDGKDYVLGLDFLSMAMVYNCGTGSEAEQKQAYAKWWQYYIERWNKLLPEMPLYSNEYYDVFSTKLEGVKDHPTNPLWGVANAIIDWSSKKDDKSAIIGNSTELSGTFRYSTFGASNPGAADLDVQDLITGYGTVVANKEGDYVWDEKVVVKSHKETLNEDGSKTFEIEIKEGLTYSDGTPIMAKDYLVHSLVFSTPVAAEAAKKDHRSAMQIVGYEDFSSGKTKELKGLRLLGDYKFSVTIDKQYIPYFYDITYAAFSPVYPAVWLDDADIKDDGNGCYITDNFYAKDGDSYVKAAHILKSAKEMTSYPFSGPYVVSEYNASDKTATLVRNEKYAGNFEGTKPQIEKITYKKLVTKTQLQDLKSGGVDILSGVTGGDATKEALALIDKQKGEFDSVNYRRAGYGKLGYRCDFGPAQFANVREAIAYCVDREGFAKTFTGGYGTVSHGPYYTGSWMYKACQKDIKLNAYTVNKDKAINCLEKDGWNYDKDGNAYTSGVRYKKIAANLIKEADKTYASKDGTYKTVKVGDFYYMPLVINWFGTVENEFTDQLVNAFEQNSLLKEIGMVVQKTTGDFYPMLAELIQGEYGSGKYGGIPVYSAFNFATGFTSAVYDYSWVNTVDPSLYDSYQSYYIRDLADVIWLK